MKRKLIIVTAFMIVLSANSAFSQVLALEEEETPEIAGWLTCGDTFRVYPELIGAMDGRGRFTPFMPSREIRALYASYDTLWIGTEGGLFAWDMLRDSLASIAEFPFSSIRAITVDDYDRLWVGCDGGVCLRDSTWKVYSASSNRFFQRVRDLAVGSRKIWIGTYGQGCGYLSSDSLVVYTEADSLLDNRVTGIAEETAARIWFGTASGVCRADSFRWESMRYGRKIPIGSVNDLIFDENRNLFLALRENGAARLKFGNTENYGISDGLPGWNINGFSLAPDGRLIAAGSGGASYYDGSGWTPLIREGLELSGYNFLSVHHDFEGNTFLGSDEGSVILLDRNGWQRLDIPQSFPALRVSRIAREGDHIYLITNRGVFRRSADGQMQKIDMPAAWYESAVTGVAAVEPGELWFSTRFGALHLKQGEWEIFDRRVSLPTEYLTSVAVGPGREIWFGTYGEGTLCLKDDRWFSYREDRNVYDNRITSLVAGKNGSIWALALSGRLTVFSDSGWIEDTPSLLSVSEESIEIAPELPFGNDPAVRIIGEKDSNPGDLNQRRCIGEAVAGGCLMVDDEAVYSNSRGEWMRLPLPDIGGRVIPTAVMENADSELWIGTEKNGLLVYGRNGWTGYGIDSGFRGGEVLSIEQDINGTVWIGTALRGLQRFNPGEVSDADYNQ